MENKDPAQREAVGVRESVFKSHAFKVMVLLTVSTTLFWGLVYEFVWIIAVKPELYDDTTYNVTNSLRAVQGAIDSILFCIAMKQVRSAVKKVLLRRQQVIFAGCLIFS